MVTQFANPTDGIIRNDSVIYDNTEIINKIFHFHQN